MDSLKSRLYNLIKAKGFVSYGTIVSYTQLKGFKISNAERRLRELCDGENAEIEPTYDPKKHYINGYNFRGKRVIINTLPPAFKPIEASQNKLF